MRCLVSLPAVILLGLAILTSLFYQWLNADWVTLHRAEKALAQGQRDDALHEIRSLEFKQVWIAPDRLRLRAAEAAMAARDIGLAGNLLAPLMQSGVMSELAVIRMAAGILDHGKETGGAIALYRKFQQEGGKLDSSSCLHLADLYRTEKHYAEAETLYRGLIRDSRGRTGSADLHLAQMLSWQQRWEEAVELFRGVLKQQPDNREARLGLARTLDWMGAHDQAADEYRKLLETP